MPTRKSEAARPPAPQEAAAAFRNTEPARKALEPAELLPINVDIPRAVSTALGTLGPLAELRPRIIAELPKHPLHILEGLRELAMAAWYAHLRVLPSRSPVRCRH
ncbi:MAG: hypothetical protein HYZ28_23300 [Myxococcales bacterium]|nr:hypothetical protein [Myxococcales bacterium]